MESQICVVCPRCTPTASQVTRPLVAVPKCEDVRELVAKFTIPFGRVINDPAPHALSARAIIEAAWQKPFGARWAGVMTMDACTVGRSSSSFVLPEFVIESTRNPRVLWGQWLLVVESTGSVSTMW